MQKPNRLSNDLTDSKNNQFHVGGQSYAKNVPETTKFATGVNFNVNMFNSTMTAPNISKFGTDALKVHHQRTDTYG